MAKYSKKESHKIEKAIIFMIKCFNLSNNNPKPVILHSTRVAMKIYELVAPVEYVIAAFLHDVVEDTKCTSRQIKKEFGSKVADIVEALTQNYGYKNYKDRWLFAEKCINKIGKYGWLIKMIDARDNLPYYAGILKSKKRFHEMMWKHDLVIRNAKKYWSVLAEYKDYKKLNDSIVRKWKIKF